jgi:hypothetical protein
VHDKVGVLVDAELLSEPLRHARELVPLELVSSLQVLQECVRSSMAALGSIRAERGPEQESGSDAAEPRREVVRGKEWS